MSENKKLCVGCNTRYELTEFYRAGRYYQKLCKPCHNVNRKKYSITNFYQKKTTGFKKLSKDKQDIIIKSLADKIPIKHIARDNGVPYITLRMWKLDGQIN